MLSAVVASGVLSSKLLLMAGFHSLRLRYPIAVLVSYGVFLLLIRVWLWYVSARRVVYLKTGQFDIGGFDVGFPSGGGSGGGSVQFGGGSSGGGGASDAFDGPVPVNFMAAPAPSGGGGGHSSWFDFDFGFDLDGDGLLILILLAVLILGIVLAAVYLVYAAPQILAEAAWQFALAGAIRTAAKQEGGAWMPGLLKSTVLPFIVVLLLATGLGWFAHHVCPPASRLLEVLHCPAV